jgi:hypothetical protein
MFKDRQAIDKTLSDLDKMSNIIDKLKSKYHNDDLEDIRDLKRDLYFNAYHIKGRKDMRSLTKYEETLIHLFYEFGPDTIFTFNEAVNLLKVKNIQGKNPTSRHLWSLVDKNLITAVSCKLYIYRTWTRGEYRNSYDYICEQNTKRWEYYRKQYLKKRHDVTMYSLNEESLLFIIDKNVFIKLLNFYGVEIGDDLTEAAAKLLLTI